MPTFTITVWDDDKIMHRCKMVPEDMLIYLTAEMEDRYPGAELTVSERADHPLDIPPFLRRF